MLKSQCETLRGEPLGKYQGEVACNRQSQTREELEHLYRIIGETGSLVEQLTLRLDMVIPEKLKSQDTSKAPAEVMLVPLASEVRDARKQLQNINGEMSALLQEIEL